MQLNEAVRLNQAKNYQTFSENYKLTVYSASIQPTLNLPPQNIKLQLFEYQDKIIKSGSISIFTNLRINFQSHNPKQIIINLNLLYYKEDQSSEHLIGRGTFVIDKKQIQKQKIHTSNILQIEEKEVKTKLCTVTIGLQIEDQRIAWQQNIQLSQDEQTEKWPSRKQEVTLSIAPLNSKKRRYYHVHKQLRKLIVENKIKNFSNILFTNMRIQDNQIMQSLRFMNEDSGEQLAKVKATNYKDFQAELNSVQIKIPRNLDDLCVQVVDLEGAQYRGKINIAEMSSQFDTKTWLHRPVALVNQRLDELKLYFSCKLVEEGNKSENQKKYSSECFTLQQQRLQKINSLQIYDFLMNSKRKIDENKLPSLQKHRMQITEQKPHNFATIQDEYLNKNMYISQILADQSPIRQRDLYQEKHYRMKSQFTKNRTIQHEHLRYYRNETLRIHVNSVIIQYYRAFMIKYGINSERDSHIPKFVKLYANNLNVVESDIIYESESLQWILQKNSIDLFQGQALKLQLCLAKQRSIIGEAYIGVSKIKMCIDQGIFYKGHLYYRGEPIGMLVLSFKNEKKKIKKKKTQTVSKKDRIEESISRLRLGLPTSVKNRGNNQQSKEHKESLLKKYKIMSLEEIPESKRRRYISLQK